MNYLLVKNTEWKEVEINGEMKSIPNSWDVSTYDKFGSFKTGKDYKEIIGLIYNVYGSSEIPMNIKTNKFIYDKPTFIIGRKGTIDKPFKVDAPFWCVDTAMFFDFKESKKRDFLFYTAKNENWMKHNSGTTVPSLVQSIINKIEFPCGSSNEQDNIASILSKQENIISNIQNLIKKNEIIFNELSEQLLSGYIRLQESNGTISLYKNPEDNWKEVEVNGKMKKIPNDWDVEVLKKHVKIINGYAFPKEKMESEKKENSIPIIKIGNIQDNLINNNSGTGQTYFNSDIKDIFIPKYNDLIVGLSGANAGKTGVYKLTEKAALNQRNAIIRVSSNKIQQSFFNLFWFKESLEVLKEGIKDSAIPNISSDDIEKIDVFILSVSEQKEITDLLTKKIELINKQKQLLLKEKEKFEWLLDNLLSGNYLVKEIEK